MELIGQKVYEEYGKHEFSICVDNTLQNFPDKYMELMNGMCERYGEDIREDWATHFFCRFFIINRVAERNLNSNDVFKLIKRKYKNYPELKRDLIYELQVTFNNFRN